MGKIKDNFEKILNLVCQGFNNEEIAQKLGYSTSNIKLYITQYRKQYKAKNITHLACIYLAEKMANY